MSLGTVFYEDSGAPRNYGLHILALTVIAQRQAATLQMDARQLQQAFLEANPRNADSKLLAAIKDVGSTPTRPIIAVFDLDKLHRLLDMPAQSSVVELRERLTSSVGPGVALVLVDQIRMSKQLSVCAVCC